MMLGIYFEQDFDKLLCMIAVVVKLHRFGAGQRVVGQQNQINNLILGHKIGFLVCLHNLYLSI